MSAEVDVLALAELVGKYKVSRYAFFARLPLNVAANVPCPPAKRKDVPEEQAYREQLITDLTYLSLTPAHLATCLENAAFVLYDRPEVAALREAAARLRAPK